MPKELETPQPPTAEEIAEVADRGEDISRFFTRKGKMMPPIQPMVKKPVASYMKYDIVKK